jgi:hypothetical protein
VCDGEGAGRNLCSLFFSREIKKYFYGCNTNLFGKIIMALTTVPRGLKEALEKHTKHDVTARISAACWNQIKQNRKDGKSDTSPDSAILFAIVWNDTTSAINHLLENAKVY